MRIAVIGAGLAGVTTSYELARDGHDVIVFERRAGIAAEGSFAPSCINAPGLWLAHAAVGSWGGLERCPAAPRAWPWLARRWQLARQPGHAYRLACMRELSMLTLDRLAAVEAAHQLDYERHRGVLVALRSARHAARAQALLASPAAQGLPVRWLEAAQAREAEPGLNPALALHGALHWPAGDTANGRQFAHALKAEAQNLGARYCFQREVSALQPAGAGGRLELRTLRFGEAGDSLVAGTAVPSVLSDEEQPRFDAVVLCASEAVAALLSSHGTRLPLASSIVHSVTAPLHVAAETIGVTGPRGAYIDPAEHVTISRMGERLRVAGRARLGASPAQPDVATLRLLYRSLDHSFPGAARTARAQAWAGAQASLPDGLPAVGRSGLAGLWLNLGHGANGWAWAGATARLLADQIAGRPALLDMTPLEPARLR
jgi:D-amino-acid dehydrogenase